MIGDLRYLIALAINKVSPRLALIFMHGRSEGERRWQAGAERRAIIDSWKREQ